SGSARSSTVFGSDVGSVTQLTEDSGHQVQRPEAVREARMLRTLISVESQTELFDATEPLKFNGIDQLHHQPAFSVVLPQRNDVVDRIAVDSLGQFFGPAIGLESQSITRLASLLAA